MLGYYISKTSRTTQSDDKIFESKTVKFPIISFMSFNYKNIYTSHSLQLKSVSGNMYSGFLNTCMFILYDEHKVLLLQLLSVLERSDHNNFGNSCLRIPITYCPDEIKFLFLFVSFCFKYLGYAISIQRDPEH